jgi:hypothetical protein
LLVFLAIVSCGSSDAPNTAPSNSRIASHGIVFTDLPENAKEEIVLVASASRSGMIRMDFSWTALQPERPPADYAWHWADESIRAAKKNNLEILALITEGPDWASRHEGFPDFRFYPPKEAHWADWETFVKAIVDRYGSKGTNQIKYWEIWNEPNTDTFWKGTAAEYAKLYSLAYEAIKSQDPGAVVLMGGIEEHNNPTWLFAVLNDNTYPALKNIDVINVHIRGPAGSVLQMARDWKTVFASQGVTGKPLWITEFGYTSDPAWQWDPDYIGIDERDGEQKQADYYNLVLPKLLETGAADKVFVTLHDDFYVHGTWYEKEGLVDATLRRKIAMETITRLSDRFK